MDSFSLDEIRAHFREDIHGILRGAVDRCAVLAHITSGESLVVTPDISALDDASHTIAGSASLVGANHLVMGAVAMGRITDALRMAAVEHEAAHRRVQRLTAMVQSALPLLAGILEHELAHEPIAAAQEVLVLQKACTAALDQPAEFLLPEMETLSQTAAAAGLTALADIEDSFNFSDEASLPDPTAAAEPFPNHESDQAMYAVLGDDVDMKSEPFSPADADIDPLIREAFAIEVGELLDGLDQTAIALNTGGTPAIALRDLFRGYHTLKGSALTVGFSALGAAAHRAEDLLEKWQLETLPRQAAATALLRVQRALRQACAGDAAMPTTDWISSQLTLNGSDAPHPEVVGSDHFNQAGAGGDGLDQRRSLRIDADQLDRLMRMAGELVVSRARLTSRLGQLADTQREMTGSRERLVSTVEGFRAHHEFSGLDGRNRTTAAALLSAGGPARGPSNGPVIGRTRGRGGKSATIIEQFTDLELDRYEEVHILARALTEISSDIGELQGQVQTAIGGIGEDTELLSRAVSGIQGEITRARMVPLEPLFARLHLAAQDAIRAGGDQDKAVRVVQQGADTALDKSIVDGLQAPLLHLVRNAVAHGIEPIEHRILAGKNPDGQIVIAARQEGGHIIVTVADDGAGLDLVKLHRRGVSLGLLDQGSPVDSEVVRNLVFAAGLSTSEQADAVAGRGFGCDIARAGIQRLGGTVSVLTKAGLGTTFTITLPLTLEISRALLVRAGGGTWAVPMNFIERIINLDGSRIVTLGGVRRIAHGADEIPLLDLAAALGARPDTLATTGAALLVRLGERRWALAVDVLMRQEEVVVSGLGELLSGHPLFAGVTLAGGQHLVPIIDLPGVLAQRASSLGTGSAGLGVAPRPSATPDDRMAAPSPIRVLFADDSLSVRKVADQLLRGLGVEVILAVDGEDALMKLRQESVDVVFTDLEMPRMHGYDLLRELRALPAFQILPVIVVTSRAGDKHRALATQLGATGYLTKPFAGDQLAAMLEQHVPRFLAQRPVPPERS